MATATANQTPAFHHPTQARRPDLVSVGTIVWLSSELMFFAALFAMYFTIRSVLLGDPAMAPEWAYIHFNYYLAVPVTVVLILSSFTAQFGVFAAERGDVRKMRMWFWITLAMGTFFVAGQGYEYYSLIVHEGFSLTSDAYGSMFYLTTGFHGLHVTGGLIAFLLVLGRTYAAKRFTHQQATSAIVVSYYWHFVDVVWIALFFVIYFIR